MHLGQIRQQNTNTAAVFEGNLVRPIPGYTLVDLIEKSEKEGVPLTDLVAESASRHAEPGMPMSPICPVEIWACGCTYEVSAGFRDNEQSTLDGMYAHVYEGARPEIFFKGTARICVGPGKAIGIRADSTFTAPEPELAVVLGKKGKILGYTIANDVSAWDIERENPLYLPQSKIFKGSCALGPVIVTADELVDPYNLEMTCTISRDGNTIFSQKVSTSRLHRRIESLVEYLLRSNPVPAGSVLLTGTGVIVPESAALQADDIVTISVPEIGELSNPAAVIS